MNNTNRIEKKTAGTRLYNVMFPIWMLTLVPSMWLYALPINFVVDSAVLLITFTVLARKRGDTEYKPWGDWLRAIPLTFVFGFVSDLIAGGFLLFWGMGPTLLLGDTTGFGAWWGSNVAEPMMENPFESIFSLLFVLLGIALAGLLIYFFNKNMSLRLTKSLDIFEIRRTAMILAVVTAPWTMLLPSVWFW